VALVLAARVLPRAEVAGRGAVLDVRGLLLLSPGLVLLIFGLSELGMRGRVEWTVVVGLAGGVVLLALFARHALVSGGRSLIDMRLFRDRAFAGAAGTTFIFGVSLFGAMLILPLYYQVVRAEGALAAGLLLAPQGLGAAMAMPVAGWLTDRLGAGRIVPVGLVVALAGTAVYTQLGATTGYGMLGVALWVRGVGLGLTMMPAMAAAYSTLDRAAVPRATTSINIIRTVGGSLGTAILTVVLERRIVANVPGATGQLDELGDVSGVADPLAHAFGQTFWWAVAMTAVAFIPAWFLPRHPPDQSSETNLRQSESTESSHAATSARASSGGAG
jgi:hypothetical protein